MVETLICPLQICIKLVLEISYLYQDKLFEILNGFKMPVSMYKHFCVIRCGVLMIFWLQS